MKPDLELKLRRDARSAEVDAPAGMFARVRGRLDRESAGEVVAARTHPRTFLVAAAILVVAGGGLWVALSSRASDRDAMKPTLVVASHDGERAKPSLFPLVWPSEGIEMAARAGEPLAREWERVKSDSMTLLRGFERQIPRL